jgi:hypothetical protein
MRYVGTLKELNGKRIVSFEVDEDIDIGELQRFSDTSIITAEILFSDNRSISAEQRKKIFAIFGDIAKWSGFFPREIEDLMKYRFLSQQGGEWFSMVNTDKTTARLFITFLIDFCIQNGIQLQTPGYKLAEDIGAYIYSCLARRVCCITGQESADIHHVEGSRIGMGGNRNKVNNAERYLIPVNRYWHERLHTEGEERIFNTFHIYGIKVDVATLKALGLKAEDIS